MNTQDFFDFADNAAEPKRTIEKMTLFDDTSKEKSTDLFETEESEGFDPFGDLFSDEDDLLDDAPVEEATSCIELVAGEYGLIDVPVNIKPQFNVAGDMDCIDSILINFLANNAVIYKGVSIKEDFLNYFRQVHPYVTKFSTSLEAIQYVIFAKTGVCFSPDVLNKIDFSAHLNWDCMKYTQRMVSLEEIELLQDVTLEEFEFLNVYSLNAELTEPLLKYYRNGNDAHLLNNYLMDSEKMQQFVEFKNSGYVGDIEEGLLETALRQGCIHELLDAVANNDTVTIQIIQNNRYNTIKDALAENKDTFEKYSDYYYFDTVAMLLNDGFSNEEMLELYFKEENVIGSYLSQTKSMSLFKSIAEGYEAQYAIIGNVFSNNLLAFTYETFCSRKDEFCKLTEAFALEKIDVRDLLLHAIMLIREPGITLDVTVPVNKAVLNHLVKEAIDTTIIDESAILLEREDLEVFQLKLNNSSYVFNVYEYIAFNESITSIIRSFRAHSARIRLVSATPGICAILFGQTNVSGLATADNKLPVSLKTWIINPVSRKRTKNAKEICETYGQDLITRSATLLDDNTNVESLVKWAYKEKDAHRNDAVLGQILSEPDWKEKIALLNCSFNLNALQAMKKSSTFTDFKRLYGFVYYLCRSFTNLDVSSSVTEQRNALNVIILSINGKKQAELTLDQFIQVGNFEVICNNLSIAKKVTLSYKKGLVMDLEGE